MRKLLCAVLALATVLTVFAGCTHTPTDPHAGHNHGTPGQSTTGNGHTHTTHPPLDPEESYLATEDDFTAKMTELLDLSLYNELSTVKGESYTIYNYSMKPENMKKYDLDYTFNADGGSAFTMPIRFSELLKKGWTLVETPDTKRDIAAGTTFDATLKNAKGQTLGVIGFNGGTETAAFPDCTVVSMQAPQYSSHDGQTKLKTAVGFTVCDSLTHQSTLEDIVKKLGNPSMVNFTVWHDEKGNYRRSDISLGYTQNTSSHAKIDFKLSGDFNYIIDLLYSTARK